MQRRESCLNSLFHRVHMCTVRVLLREIKQRLTTYPAKKEDLNGYSTSIYLDNDHLAQKINIDTHPRTT